MAGYLIRGGMRWVTVSPKKQEKLELTFVKADTEVRIKAVGKQAGDHVFLTLETDDCRKDYKKMNGKGVKFFGEPETQPYDTEVAFEDLYGNRFDIIQRTRG
jgi:IS4 transposase